MKRRRNVVRVTVTEYSTHVNTCDACMTDYDWKLYKFKLETKGIDYRYIDENSILIIKEEKKS